MPNFSLGRIAAAGALGIANHLYLNHNEPRRTFIFHTTFLLLLQPALLTIVLNHYADVSISLSIVSSAYLTFFASLTASIVLYRISPFHPLAQVPGPLLPKVTKFYAVFHCYKGKMHVATKALHDRYGPIVRIGPNEISVIEAESIQSILGANGLPKGPSYLITKPAGQPSGLTALRGQERIDRRRVWSKGFTTESLREYQQIIVQKAVQLGDALLARAKLERGEVDLMQWLNFFSFDFMAEMAFGGGSQMLLDGYDRTNAFEILAVGIHGQNVLSQLPWLSHVATYLPSELKDMAFGWCARRIENGAEKKDLWYHLMDEAGNEKVKPTTAIVSSDSIVAMVAGSDTTATAMANLFWCLLVHPETYKRLREEVDREYPHGIDPLLDTSRHANMKYLTACIHESLRVLPPVPTSGSRFITKGSGGRMIAGRFIPEGTQIFVPPYSVHSNPENFSPAPDAFIPERWLEQGSKTGNSLPGGPRILKHEAFVPFSYGPANCIGKNLAMNEMMTVGTMLLQRFDFEFADGFDRRAWRDTKLDIFVSKSGPLKVKITPRF